MRNLIVLATAVALTFLLAVVPVSRVFAGDVILIEIQVSPATIQIGSEEGEWVTVHTDIAYGLVAAADVELNGVSIAWSKADNQGNFVAKFVTSDIRGIVSPGEVELTLSGETVYGEIFSGMTVVRVVDFSGGGAPKSK
jgi:hypothetical protein